jgi:DNA-directed RNA polymerase subunit beta'
VLAGTCSHSRKIAKTKDITGGSAELRLGVRDAAEIASSTGLSISGTVWVRRLIVTDADTGAEEEHLIPLSSTSLQGHFVKKASS